MKNIFFLLPFFIYACGSELSREDLLPDATGAHGQVFLIMDDHLFNGALGEAVMYHLDQNAKGPYLAAEPLFDVMRLNSDELNHVSQLNRVLLKVMIDKDSTYNETAVIEKRNYFAKGQLFLIVKDSDQDRLYDFIVNEFAFVTNKINEFENQFLLDEYSRKPNRALKDLAEKKFGISISLPDDSQIKVDSSDFVWVKRDRSRFVMPNSDQNFGAQTYWIQQGILIWSKPYSDTSQLTIEGALRDRDTVLKYNVPGKIEGSYMGTEYDEYYKPKGKIIDYKGAYGVSLEGLWVHRGHPNAFGGGPFVQYVLHHKARKSVVTVCVYIYGPNFKKREYIREARAMLKTIEFVD